MMRSPCNAFVTGSSRLPASMSSNPFQNDGDALADADAHGAQRIASATTVQLVYAATAQMCDRPAPVSAQDARFSLQYCLAAQMLTGAVRLAAFEPDTLARADIRALMPRIAVAEAPDLSAAYPRRRMARLAVRLRDGREIRHAQFVRKGDPEAPLTDGEILRKYEELAGSVLDPEEAGRLKEVILCSGSLPGDIRFAGNPR
nr:hypothetical protein [Azospirillum sp. 412522]